MFITSSDRDKWILHLLANGLKILFWGGGAISDDAQDFTPGSSSRYHTWSVGWATINIM